MTPKARLNRRAQPNPDHHLTVNRGFFWVCCSINATRVTKEKLSFPLYTKSVETARLRRDVFLGHLQHAGLELRMRHRAAAPPVARAPGASLPWQSIVEHAITAARRAGPDEILLPGKPRGRFALA